MAWLVPPAKAALFADFRQISGADGEGASVGEAGLPGRPGLPVDNPASGGIDGGHGDSARSSEMGFDRQHSMAAAAFASPAGMPGRGGAAGAAGAAGIAGMAGAGGAAGRGGDVAVRTLQRAGGHGRDGTQQQTEGQQQSQNPFCFHRKTSLLFRYPSFRWVSVSLIIAQGL